MLNRASYNNPIEDLLEECDFEHIPADDRSPIVIATFYGIQFPALIDSGSTVSALSADMWSQLAENQKEIPCFPCNSGVRVVGAFKCKYKKVSVQTMPTFVLGNQEFFHEFLVIPSLSFPVIIGVDFLRRYDGNINLKSRNILLHVNGKMVIVPEKEYDHDFSEHPPPNIAALVNAGDRISKNEVSIAGNNDYDFEGVVSSCSLAEDEKNSFARLLEK